MTVLSPGKKVKKDKASSLSTAIHNHEPQVKIVQGVSRLKEVKEKHANRTAKKIIVNQFEPTIPTPSSSKIAAVNTKSIHRPNHRPTPEETAEPKFEASQEGYNSDDEHVPGFSEPALEASFVHRLRNIKGFDIHKVEGDGACMFRAVSLQVYGEEERHSEIRTLCIDFLARNRDHFSQFIAEDFDEYIQRKKLETTHGNHIELQAITELFSRPIEIYEYDIKPTITFHPITVEANVPGDGRPIRLSYHGATHYNAVIDPRYPICLPHIPINMCANMHDKINVAEAVRESETSHIEEQMLNDKLKMTDYERTEKDIAAQVARQSYLDYVTSLEKKGKFDDTNFESSFPSSSSTNKNSRLPTILPSVSAKRAASSPHLYSPFRDADWVGTKLRKNECVSLPNIGKEFGLSFEKTHPKLLNKEPLFDPDKPTSTKALFGLTSKIEKTDLSSPNSTNKTNELLESQTGPNGKMVDADSPWYQELLLSSAYDDDDDGLAHVLALSQEEFYNSFKST